MSESEAMKLPIFRYYFPVADRHGRPVSAYRMVTGDEFLKLTGINPVKRDRFDNDAQFMRVQPELYRALYCVA